MMPALPDLVFYNWAGYLYNCLTHMKINEFKLNNEYE